MKYPTEWNLGMLYSGPQDPKIQQDVEASRKKVVAFAKKWKTRDDYLKEPDILCAALAEYDSIAGTFGTMKDVDYYWSLRDAQDENDPAVKAQINKTDELSVRLQNEIEFFPLRLAKIDVKSQRTMLGYPGVKQYRHYLERLFLSAKYHLTEDQEKVYNVMIKTSHENWVSMTSRFLAKEERVVIDEEGKKRTKSFSEIQSLVNSPVKKVRDSSGKAMHDINGEWADVAEVELNSILETKKAQDELRGYERPDTARHIAGDINPAIVDSMIRAVESQYTVAQEYYRLKAELLGVPKLEYHERNVRLSDPKQKFTYPDAVDMIRTVFGSIDREFEDIFTMFSSGGHIDVYPRRNKSGGAFCASHLLKSPVYILLNYTEEISDILTIAHEAGHGINDEMMKKKRNGLTFGTPLSIAEVSSTFFEDFVLEHLLKKVSDSDRLALMMHKLNDDVSTVFRQVAAYTFEQELHESFREKGYLSKKDIGRIFMKHMKRYLGTAVNQSPGSENWWVYWSHFRSFFYVYSYASGLLISKALQRKVREDRSAVKSVKDMLEAGTSVAPKDVFTNAGIDIADSLFWEEGLKEVEELLRDTKKLAKRLKRI